MAKETSKRHVYLEDIPLDEAQAAFQAALAAAGWWQPLEPEEVPLAQANGRITASAVWAKLSSPHYHASAMDGYALRAQDSEGATETQPLQFTLVENWDTLPDDPRPIRAVNTGHPLPPWANAVVMIEHTQQVVLANGRSGIEIRASLPPWHHVRPMGEDMVATELVLPANHKLRPVDLGALAGSGHATVPVYRQPRVAIIPTGSELVAAEKVAEKGIQPGEIIEYNSLVLAAQVAEWGGLPTRWPIVPDNFEAIQTAVRQAAQDHDLILLNAGSSAGSEDYTADVVQSLGQLLVHGVAVRPGHPVILGMVENDKVTNAPITLSPGHLVTPSPLHPFTPIIGVPGYPVSAALTGEIFVEPVLARWQGQRPFQPQTLPATLTRKVNSHMGDDDFVRVAVGEVNGRFVTTPISRGAGVITSLVRADGIVRIPRFSEGADAGSEVTVHLYRDARDLAQTILAIGSHDLTLDLIAQFLAERGAGRLASANVGSLGGLVALRRGECHLAGSHLLDPETGIYNQSTVRRYLPNEDVVLLTLVGREQGWLVPAGNPKKIAGWEAAARDDVQLVNRQRGAGTRVLLDYELGKLGIAPEQVRGYGREEYTHLAVAAAIVSGTADFGLGIQAAARALKLDFVPLAHEQYDLVMTRQTYDSDRIRPLLDLLHDDRFKTAVAAMPGYDVSVMGQVVELNGR
ncbi:MAG: molybdopterin biosynthesis protein [Ardenticatenaceae bacterium]|nr:molybdopterin biosynthesis protein [Ardenticatenaceae bacterium]MCB8975001.1 molybdopterin biosynthesis protein [Ardenticatenaceae bacterium]